MISVVIPIYNEAAGIQALYERLAKCSESWGEDFEIVLVNDGSRDRTEELCEALVRQDPRLKLVSFTRNFGHQAAVTAGLCYSSGDIVAVIDADLQDPPEELVRFIKKCREGYDVVYAIRRKRKEGFLKRLGYWCYYRFLAFLADIEIPLDTGDFCVMSRRVVASLNALPERNRFIRGLRVWLGYRQIGLEYERDARQFGVPKYTLAKLVTLATDGLINFSFKPLRIAMLLGLLVGTGAFLLGLFVLYQYITDTTIFGYNPRQARGWTSIIISLLFLSSSQLIGIGIIGEYLGRLYNEMKGRPNYLVDKVTGFPHREIIYPGQSYLTFCQYNGAAAKTDNSQANLSSNSNAHARGNDNGCGDVTQSLDDLTSLNSRVRRLG
jgi:polyisoprenyl-phosphate glycosyltransferase